MIKLKLIYRDLKYSISNIIRWLPIIWKDRDWDHSYIYDILKFKLKNQAEYIAKKDRHVSAQHDAKRMQLCVKLIELINDNFYEHEYLNYYTSEWNFIDMPGTEYCEIKCRVINDNLDEYFNKYSKYYNKLLKIHGDKDRAYLAILIGNERANKARKLLFKIIEQNIEGWWD